MNFRTDIGIESGRRSMKPLTAICPKRQTCFRDSLGTLSSGPPSTPRSISTALLISSIGLPDAAGNGVAAMDVEPVAQDDRLPRLEDSGLETGP